FSGRHSNSPPTPKLGSPALYVSLNSPSSERRLVAADRTSYATPTRNTTGIGLSDASKRAGDGSTPCTGKVGSSLDGKAVKSSPLPECLSPEPRFWITNDIAIGLPASSAW